ncbi:hypothetical protein Micbo1qcDRAFT_200256 [Microdochium bolleyi]|uniref:MARVEL domain-containing protein n=1 Tax=Microdochium bolleyi TaxID=196109 RepID=A0A136JKE1_9PEZI|nr:hypothetical protein Micbo1qcDRAFT_200256 [Microdochium bolleyi]
MLSKLADNPWFAAKRKLPLQAVYITFVLVAMVLTGVRISKLPGQVSRSDTIAIVMGVKSIVFFAYQLSTTHVERLRRWKSLRAYEIIDYSEIVFWFVVVVLGFMAASTRCFGEACALGIVVALIALLLSVAAAWLGVIATLDRSHFRSFGVERGRSSATSGNQK